MDLKQLQEKFNQLITESESIRQKYTGSTATMTAEEESRWAQLLDEAEKVKGQIERVEREQKLRNWGQESLGRLPLASASPSAADPKAGGAVDGGSIKAAIKLISLPYKGRSIEQIRGLMQAIDDSLEGKAFRRYLKGGMHVLTEGELKALAADPDTSGGYLIAPEQFRAQLLQAIDEAVAIRQLATVIRLDRAESLGVPVLDTDVSDPDWTSELATGSEDSALAFGKRQLAPHTVAKRVKVSNKLVRQASVNPEGIVRDRLAYKFALAENKAFLTGNGTGRPLGVFTASSEGISTSRDTTAASATTFTADELIDTKFNLKPQYWPRARWVLHRDVLKTIRKFKDTTNQYIWSPGLAGGDPATVLDVPYILDENAPNTFTTGKYMACIGDFSFYWIVDALDVQVQRLVELYAESNQVGFIGRKETDGMPVLEEAFSRLKLA